jgi:hypothetical protein
VSYHYLSRPQHAVSCQCQPPSQPWLTRSTSESGPEKIQPRGRFLANEEVDLHELLRF